MIPKNRLVVVRLITLVSLAATHAVPSHAAPVTWSVNGHTYEAVLAPGIGWDAARAACSARGGYLATITSEQEELFVEDLFAGNSAFWNTSNPNCTIGPWMGAYALGLAPIWATGETTTYYTFSPCQSNFSDFVTYAWQKCPGPDCGPPHRAQGIYWWAHNPNIPWATGYVFESCDSATDTDQDGLPDCWEEPTLPIPGNGVPVNPDPLHPEVPRNGFFRLPGSDPRHKDLYVEVDAMVGKAPDQAALQSTVAAFAAAPNNNPDGTMGIRLHVVGETSDPSVDEIHGTATPWLAHPPEEFPAVEFDAYRNSASTGTIAPGHFGTRAERNAPSWNFARDAKAKAFRYCVFADAIDTDGSSGVARGIPGRDFVVSLSAFSGSGSGVTIEDQAGTFMHELGHTLGLRHGGGDDINGKPNYQSVMNYVWQMRASPSQSCGSASVQAIGRYRGSWTLNYSQQALFPLDENSLSEPFGLGGNAQIWVPVGPPGFLEAGLAQIVQMGGPVNWDRVGGATTTGVVADVNFLADCGIAGDPSPREYLSGYNDWSHLVFALPAGTEPFSIAALPMARGELTPATFQKLSNLQLDCNANGLPDVDDISAGRSSDINADGVPDECEAGFVGVMDSEPQRVESLRILGNPSSQGASIQIAFGVAARGRVRLQVYDASGARVSTVLDEVLEAGAHRAAWSPRLASGEMAPAGVYFLVSESGSAKAMTRLIMLR